MKSIAFHPTNTNIVDFMLNMVEHKGTVLEPGFGKGAFLEKLSTKPFSKIVGIEYSEEFYKEAFYLNVKLIHGDFLSFKFKEKFDLIIGNPPYMKYSSLSSAVQEEVFRLTKTKTSDIYYAFIIRSIQLLKDNGTLLFILPKSFFTNRYASFLREYILKHGYFEEIIDFGELNVFDTANVEIIIFKFRKSKKNKHGEIKVLSTHSRKKFEKAFNDLKKSYETGKSVGSFSYYFIPHFKLEDKYWSLSVNSIEYNSIKLGDIADIGVGFVSGSDEVFRLNEETLNTFSNNEKKKFVRYFLKSKNIGKYITNNDLAPMLFIDNNFKEEDLFLFSNVEQYLKKNKEKLENRYFSNKKLPYFSWLAIRNYKKIYEIKDEPILIVPSITRKREGWFNISFSKNRYISGDILYIVPKQEVDIYFLLGLLNSSFFVDTYNKFGKKKGERFIFNQGFLTNFEVPDFDNETKEQIANETKKIVSILKRKNFSESSFNKQKLKIDKIIKNSIVDKKGKNIFGQQHFVF